MKTSESMKITESGYRKARLIDQKKIQGKLFKKVYIDMIWLRKQQKNLIIKLVALKNKNVRNR